MAEALAAAVEFGPEKMTLSTELLKALTAGDVVRLEQLVSGEGRPQANGHVAINVNGGGGTSPGPVVSPPRAGASCLLGVTCNGNTALHLVASRGHAKLSALLCEKAPSLLATRNRSLDTPLHCAAKAGSRDVAACLLSAMRAAGEEAAAALPTRNCLGATALYEAVRYGRAGVVDLLMTEAPELSALTTEDGSSPLYLAASIDSLEMVRAILRPALDGTPSPASYSGPEGRTALHAAAIATREIAREMAQEILKWEPEGPGLLTKVDSSGRTPLLFAIRCTVLDVIDLFLEYDPTSDELPRISNNKGSFPVHIAAMVGSTAIIDKLVQKCPDYYEMVDAQGRNLLHCAVEFNKDAVVRYICQNDTFSMLLNAVDYDGNTPLHLAAKHGSPRIVSLLLQTMKVKTYMANKDGLTARALAIHALPPRWNTYILSPRHLTICCLIWSKATITLDRIHYLCANVKQVVEEASKEEDNLTKTGTIGSVLIATVAFASAFTVPGGFVADDRSGAGAATLARRFAFRAFAVSDTLAFVCSATATCFLILGGTREVPRNQRSRYKGLASVLLPLAAYFIIAAFAFGFHLVLGDGNRGFIASVYTVCLATVFFALPDIWVPWHLGLVKAVWRRAGWRGLVDIDKIKGRSVRQLLHCFANSFLIQYLAGPLFVALISAAFVVAIALNIALPNY
ncbi:unnamed protein product [Urochloa decumbens]|uniref:PGG domain-containing protein n=1 Tax=Urochloa decumbens TaxID=240449 RepID=A0ABC9GSU5_9POAL